MTLPPPVLDDVLPPHLFSDDQDQASSSTSTNTRRTNTSTNTSNQSTSTNKLEQLNGDRISLAVINGAGVPIASIQESSDPSHGVNGMIHTLSACSTYGYKRTANDKNKNKNKDLTIVSSTSTSEETDIDPTRTDISPKKESFQFSSTGQTLSIPQSAQKSGNVNGSLVLAFLSSRAAHHVHCLDLTVRCNPLHKSTSTAGVGTGVGTLGSGGTGSGTGTGGGGRKSSARADRSRGAGSDGNEQELDGWRGYFQPFAYDFNPNSATGGASSDAANANDNASLSGISTGIGAETSTSTTAIAPSSDRTNRNRAKIKSIAVSSDHEKDIITLGQNIYVACITDDPQSVGVAVHRNPHLYLNDINALQESQSQKGNKSRSKAKSKGAVVLALAEQTQDDTKKKSLRCTPKIECFQPMTKFDQKHRGRPLCVDVSVGIVAVGTDSGMVVLYQYKTSPGSGNNMNAALGGCNGTNKLSVLMEIPPPHASSLELELEGVENDADVSGSGSGSGPSAVAAASSSSRRTYSNDGGTANANGNHADSSISYAVSSVKLVTERTQGGTDGGASKGKNSNAEKQVRVFVTYRRHRYTQGDVNSDAASIHHQTNPNAQNRSQRPGQTLNAAHSGGSGGGVCCYDLGTIALGATFANSTSSAKTKSAPHARYDLDGREVASSCLCDMVVARRDREGADGDATSGDANAEMSMDASRIGNASQMQGQDGMGGSVKFIIARPDGLYTYSSTDKISVSPIDGSKIAMCAVPPPPVSRRQYHPHRLLGSESGESKVNSESDEIMTKLRTTESGASYVLIATTDLKSGRDAVDIYDASNKLVAFHLLLSPGHRALGAVGVTTTPKAVMDGHKRGGLSSAVIFTSGGSIVTLTEKVTSDKVSLLVQKNLYAAAISMAFADPTYQSADITALFRKHAEHLYRKGDFSASMDQYIYTIGSLEPSHVIFRFLDAPKIPLLTKYLEELRSRDIATSVHCELLRTCYLKLNDVNMAEKISASLSKSITSNTCNSLVSSLLHNPVEALATICSFDAPHAVEALKTHGSTLAKALPKETAGIVITLCDGVYSPTSVGAVGSSGNKRDVLKESLESSDRPTTCDMYPVHLFSSAFLENPKLLRVILAHCDKNRRRLNSSLMRMLLELTLEEWNAAKRAGALEREDVRRREAIAMLSEPGASEDLGDYEALVVVQQQDFVEGMIMLYEKLQLAPMLMEKYAEDGSYKARRQMLAMCRSDPELLADVLGYFVSMASDLIGVGDEDRSINSESDVEELLDDIKEALSMARSHGVLPPVRVARILAGDGIGQFTEERRGDEENEKSLPLSVALDYIGAVMDEQSQEIDRLKSNIEEYNALCNDMESEINELVSIEKKGQPSDHPHGINIAEMYSKLMDSPPDNTGEKKSELASEEFWRQMEHSSDRFETLARFFAKDILE